jgi:hypothetical protein
MSSALLFRRVFQRCSLNLISTRFTSSATIDPQFKKKVDDFIQSNKIAIFIKGEPGAPRMMKFLHFSLWKIYFDV